MWLSADTDKGKMREMNQDSYEAVTFDNGCYAIVCDGMGGENGGQVASRIAVEVAKKQLSWGFKGNISENEARRILSCAVNSANLSVYDEASKYPDLKGMGTTMTIAVVTNQMAHIASVGDSRAYVLRDDLLTQVTSDHTFVRELVVRGKITEEEAKVHPKRHMITRAIGAGENVSPDIFSIDLKDDDSILVCTDGLYNFVSEEDLAALTAVCVRKRDAAPLIMRANEKGGGDNITAVLISLSKGGAR